MPLIISGSIFFALVFSVSSIYTFDRFNCFIDLLTINTSNQMNNKHIFQMIRH